MLATPVRAGEPSISGGRSAGRNPDTGRYPTAVSRGGAGRRAGRRVRDRPVRCQAVGGRVPYSAAQRLPSSTTSAVSTARPVAWS